MPDTDPPFFREAGQGDGVVCLHANSSNSAQFRGLMELLAPRFHVLAPDLRGAGQSPAYPVGRGLTLADEAALLEPVFARAGTPFTLVGHSYGGAVALITALRAPQRVRALVLFEPTLFSVVETQSGQPGVTDGIRNAVADALDALARGAPEAAATRFIDYWMGVGALAAMPAPRRDAIVAGIGALPHWADALFREPTPLAEFARLTQPVLLMTGRQSPAPARAVAQRLAAVLPNVQTLAVEGAGHMAPITHPERVNAPVAAFIERFGHA